MDQYTTDQNLESILDIRDNLEDIKYARDDQTSTISNIGIFLLCLITVITVFGDKHQIDTTNILTLSRSILFVWGFTFLFISGCMLLITIFLSIKIVDRLRNKISDKYGYFDYGGAFMRLLLIAATLISTQIKSGMFLFICSAIGFILILGLYIYYGKLFPFPQDASNHMVTIELVRARNVSYRGRDQGSGFGTTGPA